MSSVSQSWMVATPTWGLSYYSIGDLGWEINRALELDGCMDKQKAVVLNYATPHDMTKV
jgi:hypothetical protein